MTVAPLMPQISRFTLTFKFGYVWGPEQFQAMSCFSRNLIALDKKGLVL